jgi:hypothetical protein
MYQVPIREKHSAMAEGVNEQPSRGAVVALIVFSLIPY